MDNECSLPLNKQLLVIVGITLHDYLIELYALTENTTIEYLEIGMLNPIIPLSVGHIDDPLDKPIELNLATLTFERFMTTDRKIFNVAYVPKIDTLFVRGAWD